MLGLISPHPLLFRHLQLLQLQSRSVRRGAQGTLHGCAPHGNSEGRDGEAGGAGEAARADTIYFGGGTPSLLEAGEIDQIIAACRDSFAVAAGSEVTLEANPETTTADRLRAYRAAGVNRLSFGVQSFRDDELRRLSRLHGADRARAAFAEARAAGFDNVSLDLMMWLPGQSIEEWLDSVDQAIALAPEHLSLYLLEVYPNAPLKEAMARALVAGARRRCGGDVCGGDGAARSGRLRAVRDLECRAPGTPVAPQPQILDRRRVARVRLRRAFHARRRALEERVGDRGVHRSNRRGEPAAVDVRRLSDAERLGDALFTGLRLSDGVDEFAIERRYGVDIWQRYGADLQPFLDTGLLKRQNRRLWLTRRGMLLAHEVMTVFV